MSRTSSTLSDNAAAGTRIACSKIGKATILVASVSLTHESCQDLEVEFENAMSETGLIVLDLRSVAFIDSEGLELLVRIHDCVNDKGGSLRLVHVNEVCTDILVATRLLNVFDVYRDVQTAIAEG